MSSPVSDASPPRSPRYDAVYLSPHLDDAVLSCGGQIHRRVVSGQAVLVATVGTADESPSSSQLVLHLHRAWGLEDGVVAARRREDAAACELLGAHWLHLGLPEAIYRCHPGDRRPLYPTLGSLFRAAAPADALFAGQIASALQRQLPAHDELLAPLAAGGHVDHVLTRAAAELFATELALYEDFPYSQSRWRLGSRRRLAGPFRVPRVVSLEPADLDARYRASLAYGSQIPALFRTPERLRRRLEAHARRAGGERLWRRA